MEGPLERWLILSQSTNKHGHSAPLKPLGQIKQYFAGSIHGRSSIRFPQFTLIEQKTWAILVSDWLTPKQSFPLKLGGTMNCFFVGMMYERSCTNFYISCRSCN